MSIIGKSANCCCKWPFIFSFEVQDGLLLWAFQFLVNQCHGSVEIVSIHKQAAICHPGDIASFLVTMFVNALRKAISTFSISLKRNNRNFLSKRYELSASWKELSALYRWTSLGLQHGTQIAAKPLIANISDIMLRPLGVPNVPTSVFLQDGNLNGVCIDLVRLNAHRV